MSTSNVRPRSRSMTFKRPSGLYVIRKRGGKKEGREGEKKKVEKEKDLATDRVKIALLYFLKGALLGADPKRNVSTFHMSMVEYLDMFNSYP